MAGMVYFGNSRKQLWVKAPQSGMDATPKGYASKVDFLNGGTSIRRSNYTHREFAMSWTGEMNGTDASQDLSVFKDFYDGIYGPGPFYWLDPYAMDKNALPPHWAAPMLGGLDWPKMDDVLPSSFIEATYDNNFPYKYASYVSTGNYESTRKATIIIPEGYTLHFGWHSTVLGQANGIQVKKFNRATGASTSVMPASILAGNTAQTNTQVDGNTYSRVEISIKTVGAATVNIVAMFAVVLADGIGTPIGKFISGRGTHALEFVEPPTMSYISSKINGGMIEMSATLVEAI